MHEPEIWEAMEQNANRCREAWSSAGEPHEAHEVSDPQPPGAAPPHGAEAARAMGDLELPVEWIV